MTNDTGNSLTPIDPRTGRHGRPVPCPDPYNLYFTADGRRAIVVAEAHRELDFREPHTMRLVKALHAADVRRRRPHGLHRRRAPRARLLRVRRADGGGRPAPRARGQGASTCSAGAMPQDVKLSPDGRTFYVADMASNGVWLIDARQHAQGALPAHRPRRPRPLPEPRLEGPLRLQPRGGDDHADLLPHAPAGAHVADPGRRLARTWAASRPTGASCGCRAATTARSTRSPPAPAACCTASRVGHGPHGLCVWPQPGRYSIGHTGILR